MTSTPLRWSSAICSQMAERRIRDGRPSSFATTEVPALIRMRRVVRRARRDLVSLLVDVVMIVVLLCCCSG